MRASCTRLINLLQEWTQRLRSSIQPILFAMGYALSSGVAGILRLSPMSRADLLVATPKAIQAVVAASGDFYTWKMARPLYGPDSTVPAVVVSRLAVEGSSW